MTKSMKTKKIAGYKITLAEGVRYFASRPGVTRERKKFDVTIEAMIGSPPDIENVVIKNLSYDESNRLINSFNNGSISFDGRVW